MAEFYSVKAPNFLYEIFIFLLKLIDLHSIFLAKKDPTIKYFRCFMKQISLKLITLSLDENSNLTIAALRVPGLIPSSGNSAHFCCGKSSDNLFRTHYDLK